jgi:hypothetical protein
MPRFQLVFRDPAGDRAILVDSPGPGQPAIDGQRIELGVTIEHGGRYWLVIEHAREDDLDRYVLARPEPDDAV